MAISLRSNTAPQTEEALLARCQRIEGLTFSQLGLGLDMEMPLDPLHRKGWLGQAIEQALGADASTKSMPDFQALGIELKTIPIAASGKPTESTFVTTIPLLTIHQQHWETSQCFAKLKRVLWILVEGDTQIPYPHRRIGSGFIWSPSAAQETVLAADWNYLTLKISTGQLEMIDATVGDYLQVRPKGACGKSLCDGFDAEGNKIKTLPRGFYLRSQFTSTLLIR